MLEDPLVRDDIGPRCMQNKIPRVVLSRVACSAHQLGLAMALWKVFGMGRQWGCMKELWMWGSLLGPSGLGMLILHKENKHDPLW